MTQLPNPFLNSTAIQPPAVEDPAVALPRTSDAQTGAAAGTFDEEYRCPGGQIVDAAGCELCGPISNADCPYWPDEPTSNEGRPEEAPASAPTKNPDAGALGTDCIGEIFFYARKLMTGEIPAFVLDEAAFMAEVEETPLFLREDGYLQRREA